MASKAGSIQEGSDGHDKKSDSEHHGLFSEVPPLFDRAKQRADELYQSLELERRVGQNPTAMLLAAWGIGFVLGGGLASGLGKRVLGMGLKAGMKLFVPMIAEKAWSMKRNAGNGSSRRDGYDRN